MATDYVVLPVYDKDLREFDSEFTEGYFEGYEDALVRREDGTIKEVLYVDGAEPEDMYLSRDLSWVPGALHDAYRRGAQDALKGKLDE